MKKLFLSLSAAALCTGLALAPTTVLAQQGPRPPPVRSRPTRSASIDMAFVFKNYDKFKTMTKALQEEAQGAQKKADAMIEEMKSLQSKLQGGDLAEGSRRLRPHRKPAAQDADRPRDVPPQGLAAGFPPQRSGHLQDDLSRSPDGGQRLRRLLQVHADPAVQPPGKSPRRTIRSRSSTASAARWSSTASRMT